LAGTKEIMHFIAKEISPSAYVNIMDQYRPCYKAINYPQLSRGITREEYEEAVEIASQEGLSRGFSYEN
jgi:putative pyruvate formate lyase activating enzyme